MSAMGAPFGRSWSYRAWDDTQNTFPFDGDDVLESLSNDLLYHASDVVFAEIIDPQTLARLPIEAGTTGARALLISIRVFAPGDTRRLADTSSSRNFAMRISASVWRFQS